MVNIIQSLYKSLQENNLNKLDHNFQNGQKQIEIPMLSEVQITLIKERLEVPTIMMEGTQMLEM